MGQIQFAEADFLWSAGLPVTSLSKTTFLHGQICSIFRNGRLQMNYINHDCDIHLQPSLKYKYIHGVLLTVSIYQINLQG